MGRLHEWLVVLDARTKRLRLGALGKPWSDKPTHTYDPAERAREKAAARAEDARAIASGEKAPEDVARDNASFAFPGATIRLPKRERS